MNKYYPPAFDIKQFHSIHCNVCAKQEWDVLCFGYHSADASPIKTSFCEHCKNIAYWYEKKMIVPTDSVVPPPHTDMPVGILGEYNEARDIFGRSPRAAVALLR